MTMPRLFYPMGRYWFPEVSGTGLVSAPYISQVPNYIRPNFLMKIHNSIARYRRARLSTLRWRCGPHPGAFVITQEISAATGGGNAGGAVSVYNFQRTYHVDARSTEGYHM